MKTRFNAGRADAAASFFDSRLHLTKGRWSGVRFTLPDWQRDEIIRPLFGSERFSEELDQWVRRYRRAWIEIPKKNGKSPLGAGIALQGLLADGEKSPEVYGIAAGKRQAGIVFNSAARMVELEPALSRRSEVFKSKLAHHGVIHVPRSDGYYRVIPGDAEADDGISPSRVIVDEVHRIRNREILDLLDESFAGRSEPLVVYLTTAGERSRRRSPMSSTSTRSRSPSAGSRTRIFSRSSAERPRRRPRGTDGATRIFGDGRTRRSSRLTRR